ncbi:TM2 domain-containing protein [Pseudodonghicola xiamenensis]|uniref:TM2 domain-containing protein n=1 Tax=Pseudodonghicola xiamenensis TaxID=337702 RepID=A0A8J3H6L1_9RHOB|nr:TM2 domain-containing protein [Pseudodonghicola xiamenensis]GHG93082.1 hypothetical protein GCM10010961_25330 [Pseudodonghicola xiamenensis]
MVTLSTEQQMLVEQRLSNDKKSMLVCYLLWFFLGGFGAHRFYLGKTQSAVIMLIIYILGWLMLFIYVGAILLLGIVVWLIIDAFTIPGMVEQDSQRRRETIQREVGLASKAT